MDSLGDRMKWYERRYTEQVVLPMIPVICRIDGKSFHTFTKGLERPYDQRLSQLMVDTTKFLVEETGARCGYTQSDEISLCWLTDDPKSEIFFRGKLFKLISVVGSMTTAFFNKRLPDSIPEKADQLAMFDSRVWEVPLYYEASNYFIWREQDATRNSISMAAQSLYSHKNLHKKSGSEMQEMLFQKGINWNNYPRFFKRGTYVRKRVVERPFTVDEMESLPPKHRAHTDPDLKVQRSVVMEEDLPVLTTIQNRDDVILFGADPIVGEDVR